MITDDEFEALFHEAGGDFAVPTRGPDEILAAAAPPVKRDGNVVRARFRPRELVLAGTGIAAVVALTVALLTSSGGSPAPLGGVGSPPRGREHEYGFDVGDERFRVKSPGARAQSE